MRELGEGMIRIYTLFKKNELAPPDLISENQNFTIRLHHKSVYSSEQKIWLDEFRDDNLSFNEKSVVLLGYGGNKFSADDIWGAVGIVDTEDYRKLVYSLQSKGILASIKGNLSALRAEAKKTRVPFRKFKRYYIIKPEQRGQARSEINDVKSKTDGVLRKNYEDQRIYVTNIPYEIKDDDLYELFSSVGNIEDISIPLNHETGHPRGFAFISFGTKKEAEKAIEKFNGSFLGNRKIAITWAYREQRRLRR